MQTEEFIEEVKMNLLRNHAIRMTDGDAWSAIESTFQITSRARNGRGD